MTLDTKVTINPEKLNNLLESDNFPLDDHTRLVMSDDIVCALTDWHFYEKPFQVYCGCKIIQDERVPLGDVIILVNYENLMEE